MADKKPGAFKLSFAGSKNLGALKAKSSTPLAKRPRLALGDDEADDTSKTQEISGWDTATGGAIDLNGAKKEEKPLLVIPSLPNRNWHEEARRKQAAKAEQEDGPPDEAPKAQYGLTVFKQAEETQEDTAPSSPSPPPEPIDDGLTPEERLDRAAREALQNGKPTEEAFIIPAVSEDEAFNTSYSAAPDAPSLSAYEATPIDGFGAAMLRGMGWKDGEEIGRNKGSVTKAPEVKRRPALLGIGADEKQAAGVELGEWGNSAKGKGKGRRKEQAYTPVVLRNKITGEMVTEEELKVQIREQEEAEAQDRSKSRRSKREGEGEERDRRRITDGDDRRRDRKRDHDTYSEDERRRERRHKERRDDRDRDRDRDRRERSPDRDARRRDRSRDADRRRRERTPDEDRSRDKRERGDRRDRGRERESSPDERRRDKHRDRRDRSRSPARDGDGDERRKRRRERDYEYDDGREERKRRYRD